MSQDWGLDREAVDFAMMDFQIHYHSVFHPTGIDDLRGDERGKEGPPTF